MWTTNILVLATVAVAMSQRLCPIIHMEHQIHPGTCSRGECHADVDLMCDTIAPCPTTGAQCKALCYYAEIEWGRCMYEQGSRICKGDTLVDTNSEVC